MQNPKYFIFFFYHNFLIYLVNEEKNTFENVVLNFEVTNVLMCKC